MACFAPYIDASGQALDLLLPLYGIVRQAADLMALVPQLASGFSFGHAEGIQLDALGESVSVPRQEDWDDETYRSMLLKKLILYTWNGTNKTAFDYVNDGESFRDNGDGTVTAYTDLPLPADEGLPVPIDIRAVPGSVSSCTK